MDRGVRTIPVERREGAANFDGIGNYLRLSGPVSVTA